MARNKIFKKVRWALKVWNTGYNPDILFHGDHVAVYPELGLVFNRIKKSGNTTVSAFLADLSNDFSYEVEKGFKEKLLKPKKMRIFDIRKIKTLKSLVVVRNPYSRALSGFLDKLSRGTSSTYQGFSGFGNDTPEGFLAFLQFLKNGNMHLNRHFWPQEELLFQPVERFDYVIKLENIEVGMQKLLEDIGKDPAYAAALKSPHKVEAGGRKITSASRRLQQYFTPAAIILVQEIYAKDFRTFDYSTEFSDV